DPSTLVNCSNKSAPLQVERDEKIGEGQSEYVFHERKRLMNIAQGLAHAVKVAGNRPAISCGETEYTWSQFAYRTDCLARGLAQLGIERGDRVAVLMLNCHRYFELYYACARMGAVIVPLNTRLAPLEIDFILNDSEARVLIVDKAFAALADQCENFPSVQQIVYSGPQNER